MAVTTNATAELESLLELVATQDARIAALEAENDFLHRERILYREGPQELLRQFSGPSAGEPTPPGYGRGNSGQLIILDPELLYQRLREQRLGL
ncbi:hypothetical protein [Methylobacterium sp. Leaf466]|uniref:hypothetical protein n=1 Tax=Methylobacterium sp. Leaf466 TaxID=1736386 RepID=UPI0012E3E4AE|nr:hypothetical protein [Methylobacterium sp. Leaf466]